MKTSAARKLTRPISVNKLTHFAHVIAVRFFTNIWTILGMTGTHLIWSITFGMPVFLRQINSFVCLSTPLFCVFETTESGRIFSWGGHRDFWFCSFGHFLDWFFGFRLKNCGFSVLVSYAVRGFFGFGVRCGFRFFQFGFLCKMQVWVV